MARITLQPMQPISMECFTHALASNTNETMNDEVLPLSIKLLRCGLNIGYRPTLATKPSSKQDIVLVQSATTRKDISYDDL